MMNEQEIKALQQELAAAKKTLSLIQAIDQIRDGSPDPLAMLSAIAKQITDELNADLCLLMLRNRETDEIELKVVHQKRPLSTNINALITPARMNKVNQLRRTTSWQKLPFPDGKEGHTVAVPIIMGEDHVLGSMLLIRNTSAFTNTEIQLLETAEDHIDSAIVQGYAYHDLRQYVNEIETIYQIDRIRDQGLPFDDMLTAVVSKLENLLNAEAGFVMLYDYTGKNLEMRAVSHENLFQPAQQIQQLNEIAAASLTAGNLICRNDMTGPLNSLMCLPLILNERIIGVLGVANRKGSAHFYQSDQRLLSAIGSQMDTAIFESLEQKRLRRVLGRSVDPRIMQQILSNPGIDFLEGERRFLTVLYADIRGSTTLAEKTPPEQLVRFINSYLSEMTHVILESEGTLDKFVGDEVMALFGAPFSQEDHALR
ncbi:MAG: GAF domain-containing protein, partial [Anaerolineales bacterium]|nr:GAF domain-containing protein [Anaerolineales bacterium]